MAALHSEVASMLTLNGVIAMVVSFIERSKYFPWIQKESMRLKRGVAYVLAAGAAVGVHATFDHSAGTLIITGLSLTAILTALWGMLQAILVQEGIFQLQNPKVVVVNRPEA